MFFILEIKRRRTPLYSPKRPQSWRPVLVGCSCQRSETLLRDLIAVCYIKANYFKIVSSHFRAQYISFCLDESYVLTPQGATGFYNIDNEEYEAMPVEIRLLPRKLRFFISAERREELLLQMQ